MKYIDEVNLKDKTVIVRVDYNVPFSKDKVTDDFKIMSSLDTINYLLDQNCKIILLSHLGRVKEEKDKRDNDMKIVYNRLKSMCDVKVHFSNTADGDELDKLSTNLKNKEILLVQNTRFEDVPYKRESECDDKLSKYWASLADVFVMDAFGTCHREHASTYGISKYLPTCYGFLIKKEMKALNEAVEDEKKILILGGAKVSDKIKLIDNLIDKSSKILIGGKMCFTFLAALGNKIDKSLIEEDQIDYVNNLMSNYKDKIVLPFDLVNDKGEEKELEDITEKDVLMDIGNDSCNEFISRLKKDSLVVWNGPLGYVEDPKFERGTLKVLRYLAENDIKTIIAGGDTAAMANKYKFGFYHISTGGGATLEFLEGKEMRTLEGEYYEEDSIE